MIQNTLVLIDNKGHLTVQPFNIESLRLVGDLLQLTAFDKSHFDIPGYRIEEFSKRVEEFPGQYKKVIEIEFLQYLVDEGQHSSISEPLDSNVSDPLEFGKQFIRDEVKKPLTDGKRYSKRPDIYNKDLRK